MTKLKIMATGQSPDYYEIVGEVITAHLCGEREVYDLRVFPEGAAFEGADPVGGVTAIRNVRRVMGELHVDLCQAVGPGHWRESAPMESTSYDPDMIHVRIDRSKPFSGTPWAKTRQGKVEV